jgi:hypothetical protein
MDAQIRELAAGQVDVVAAWQLLAAGFTRRMVDHRLRERGWRIVHPGVYALTSSALTRPQQWVAATLTTPDSVLSQDSAAARFGFRAFDCGYETITRPGSGGLERLGGLLVRRSSTLAGDTILDEGVATTTPERTLIDIAPRLNQRQTGRAFRESIRLKLTTAREIDATVARHKGRRGTRKLGELAVRYASIPYQRTRSDPEGRSLEVLRDADVEPPLVNAVVAGEEADLIWPRPRRIIEIDGPQFHQFKDEDARKQAVWEAAGYTVRRIPSGAVYADPRHLVALATGHQPT